MKNTGKSKSALKREAKEKELYESSWKLADSMYSRLWPDRWELLKKSFFIPRNYCRFDFMKKEESEEMENFGKFSFLYCEESDSRAPEVVVDKEALFLCNILNPIQGENVLGINKLKNLIQFFNISFKLKNHILENTFRYVWR